MGITLGAAFNFGKAGPTKSPVLFSSLSLTEFGWKIENWVQYCAGSDWIVALACHGA
jgi:hypothetical protein